MDVYRALYPPGSLTDSIELESLARRLEKRYGINVFGSWREDITLGELYAQTHTSGLTPHWSQRRLFRRLGDVTNL